MITANYYALLALLLTGMALSVWLKKLTIYAAITGGVCAFMVYQGAGYAGIAAMAVFFVIGTVATGWKNKEKQQLKAAENNGGKRKASQVLANAGVAALAGILSLCITAHGNLWALLIAASFSAATADTLASELGTVYGKRFYNILTLKPDERGLDGVISIEGTFIGLMGSALIAIIHTIAYGLSWQLGAIIIAGTIGNITDSVLGAALERKGWLQNDAVNFLNTLTATLVAALMYIVA
jgi:uncharacterized protein (TIGR00297 family)